MTTNHGRINLMLMAAALLAALSLMAPVSHADCAKDIVGEVYCGGGRCIRDSKGVVSCSRHYEGDAQVTRDGTVVCGKGKCEKNIRGEIFCSSEKGGAVLKDSRGRVRCYGKCERATVEQCEKTPADDFGESRGMKVAE